MRRNCFLFLFWGTIACFAEVKNAASEDTNLPMQLVPSLPLSLAPEVSNSEVPRRSRVNHLDEAFLMDHLGYFSSDTRAKIVSGDRSAELLVRAKLEAGALIARKNEIELSKAQIELRLRQQDHAAEQQRRAATEAVSVYVSQSFRDMESVQNGETGLLKRIKDYGDAPWSPDEQEKINSAFGQITVNAALEIDRILSGFSALPPDVKQQIRQEAMARYDVIRQTLLNENFGRFRSDARYIEAQRNSDVRKQKEDSNILRKLKEMSKVP